MSDNKNKAKAVESLAYRMREECKLELEWNAWLKLADFAYDYAKEQLAKEKRTVRSSELPLIQRVNLL